MHARPLRRASAAACVVALLTSGCSSTDAPGEDGGPAATVTTDASDTPSPAAAATEGPLADAVFLTAVDEVVAGTRYEGLVDAVPGEFLLTATLVCDRLAAGERRSDVLGLYLDALGAGDPTTDDARLAGALVGASIEVYCPENAP